MAKKAKKNAATAVAEAISESVQTGRKSKKRRAASVAEEQPMDAMSQCVAFCQEQRWREALLLCKRLCEKAAKEGGADACVPFAGAQTKIEYSLRRQMAASLVVGAREMLAKEYLLDVGE